MTRWMTGAVLAAGSLMLTPLQATAQEYEKGTVNSALLCGYFPDFSFAVIESRSPKPRAECRWKCVYKLSSGRAHINQGVRTLAPGHRVGMDTTKKVMKGIVEKVSAAASCN